MKRILASAALLFLLVAMSQAAPIKYYAHLTGPAESPPNASPGTGTALVVIDTVAHTLSVDFNFSGLLGTTTTSHIHCCTASPGTGAAMVATQIPLFVGFPVGVTSGSYSKNFDTYQANTWNNAFIEANGGTPLTAESALAGGLQGGTAYLNIHTLLFPGGEIRGFLVQTVPEPASLSLAGSALIAFLAGRKRLKR